MIKAIGHLGIVVKNIEISLDALSQILDFERPAIREFPGKKMKCAVVEVNGISLEFLQDDSEEGFLGQFVRKNGNSIHHFCLLSDSIEKDIESLKQKGIAMMDQSPRIGLRGKKIAFIAPEALDGITIELSEP